MNYSNFKKKTELGNISKVWANFLITAHVDVSNLMTIPIHLQPQWAPVDLQA